MHSQDQIFTVFGGSYVAERSEHSCLPVERRSSGMKWLAVVGLIVAGVSTASATKSAFRSWTHNSGFVVQMVHFEDALY